MWWTIWRQGGRTAKEGAAERNLRTRRRGRTLLCLEVLEDRTVLSPVTPPPAEDPHIPFQTEGITVLPTGLLHTSQAGESEQFNVVLDRRPTANVTIGLTSSKPTEGTVSTSSLTFTPANWNTLQTVTVTGQHGTTGEDDQLYRIVTAPAVSSDPYFNGRNAADVLAINLHDSPDINFSLHGLSGLFTSEDGGKVTNSVVLDVRPTANVVVHFYTENSAEGVVTSSDLTFTPDNWNTPQTFTVTGVEDSARDGDVVYMVRADATSADPAFRLTASDVMSLVNRDNDGPALQLGNADNLFFTEGDGGRDITARLTSRPTANVTVGFSTFGGVTVTQGPSLDPVTLTFTPSNWNTPQSVTVAANRDHVVLGDRSAAVVLSSSSSDPDYHGLNPVLLLVNIKEIDVAGVQASVPSLITMRRGGSGDFPILLASIPTADVVVTLTPDSRLSVSQKVLTLNPTNWGGAPMAIPPMVKISAVNDGNDESAWATVKLTVSSADTHYNGLTIPDIKVHILGSNDLVLAPIPDLTVKHGELGTVDLSTSDADGDPITYTVEVQSMSAVAWKLRLQLGLTFTGNYYTDYYHAAEKWLRASDGRWYFLTPDGLLFRDGSSLAGSKLVARLDSSFYTDPSLLFNAQPAYGSDSQVFASLSGSRLTLNYYVSFVGTRLVEVTVHDGAVTDRQSFLFTVTNTAPVLAPVADRTMQRGHGPVVVDLSATDAEGDYVNYGALVKSAPGTAWEVNQNLRLSFTGNYWTDYYHANEKWLQASSGRWYFLTPAGRLYRAGTKLADSVVVATLDPSCYLDPSLLYNAPAPATISELGNRLTITPNPSFVGSMVIEVYADDRATVGKGTFTLTVTNTAPVLAPLADQTVQHGKGPVAVNLSATDAEGDPVTCSAVVKPAPGSAWEVGQRLGLTFTGNYWTDYYHASEKWLLGKGGQWYFLTPDGKLYRAGATLADSVLEAALDAACYADPGALYDAQAPAVSAAVAGNKLTLTPSASFAGSFVVEVSASDGAATTKGTFTVNVTNNAPVLGNIADKTMQHGHGPLVVTLPGSDADGETLTYSAVVKPAPGSAWDVGQRLGLTFTGNHWLNYYGAQEKWLLGKGGRWYFVTPEGKLYRAGAKLADSVLEATLDAASYADPGALYDAQAPAVSAAVAGNKLTLTPGASFAGSFVVEVSARDGAATAKGSFTVNVTNNVPVLGTIADQTIQRGKGPLVVSLPGSDADGETLTYSVVVKGAPGSAWEVGQRLGLTFTGNYWTDYYHASEKWLLGKGGQWYFLKPDGKLCRAGAKLDDSVLEATFDPSYYASPALLYNAHAPALGSITGNSLTLNLDPDFLGSFVVEVSVSDGAATARGSFTVNVTTAAAT